MTVEALLLLALKGVLVAAVPLAYVRYSRDPHKFRKLAWVTAFLTLDLIMFGSFTRLTDSGLGCPDWPLCYGQVIPPLEFKAWAEWIHRLIAAAHFAETGGQVGEHFHARGIQVVDAAALDQNLADLRIVAFQLQQGVLKVGNIDKS